MKHAIALVLLVQLNRASISNIKVNNDEYIPIWPPHWDDPHEDSNIPLPFDLKGKNPTGSNSASTNPDVNAGISTYINKLLSANTAHSSASAYRCQAYVLLSLYEQASVEFITIHKRRFGHKSGDKYTQEWPNTFNTLGKWLHSQYQRCMHHATTSLNINRLKRLSDEILNYTTH